MSKIYLIRHAMPDFPVNEKVCIGSAEVPLGVIGRMQCFLLEETFKGKVDKVYTSRLGRAVDTGKAVGGDVTIVEGLEEMCAGDWDGLNFKEIRKRWPEVYEARMSTFGMAMIPNAESDEDGLERFKKAFNKVLDELKAMDKDAVIAVVAHATVIQLFICDILGLPLTMSRQFKPKYAAWYELEMKEDGGIAVTAEKVKVVPPLTDEICKSLMEAAKNEERIIKHCEAVADEACRIAENLNECLEAGEYPAKYMEKPIDIRRLRNAALLHDIARKEKDHAYVGQKYVEILGYGEVAEIIGAHHELEEFDLDFPAVDEKAVLYLADKRIKEDRKVSVSKRFEESMKKCKTLEAVTSHERRRKIAEKLDEICEKC